MTESSNPVYSILDTEAAVKRASSGPLRPLSYTRRSSGTRDLSLIEPISNETGYWKTPNAISSKPPRWIVHIDATTSPPKAHLALDENGAEFIGSGTPGYINNGQGKCALAAFRLMPAIKVGQSRYVFPKDWEWIVQFAFSRPLPSGTSGDALTDFSVSKSEICYRGRGKAKEAVPIERIMIVRTMANPLPLSEGAGIQLTYDQVTDALTNWLREGPAKVDVYDAKSALDLQKIHTDLESVYRLDDRGPAASVAVSAAPELVGIPESVYRLINSALSVGKRHFVFHGPPGTGKTTLAEYIAEQIAGDDSSTGESPYTLLTGSSSWSSQDLVGGYQPMGHGRMSFVPGAMLRDFHKPMIIDELNRCPIDKVIGPLFSILSGQSTTLPYRMQVEDPSSACYRILPKPSASKSENEFAPGPNWALLCTLNQVDKTQLEQISFALSRRFTWVRIGIPEDPALFVRQILEKLGFLRGAIHSGLPNPVADMWMVVNEHRELGGAPVIDFLRLAAGMDNSIDFLAAPTDAVQEVFILVLASTFLPLLDGISRADAKECSLGISKAWGLSPRLEADLNRRFLDLAP